MDDVSLAAAQLVVKYTESVDAALSYTADRRRDAAADREPMVAEAVASIARRMVRQSGAVAYEVSELLDVPYASVAWNRSLVKLADIALLASIEMAETTFLAANPSDTKSET